MFGKTTAALLLLAAFTAVPAVQAETVTVGDCSLSGACASVCALDCDGGEAVACVGVSFQVPQCVPNPTMASSTDARCMGAPCDAIIAVCWIVLKAWCVG